MYNINGKRVEVWGNMVVGNEDVSILTKCLDSICPLVDTMLVGFNGNDKRIPELFSKYANVKWFAQKWEGDIVKCRREVFDKTPSGVLLLWIDSDDIITHAENIKEFSEEVFAHKEINGWMCQWHYARNSLGQIVGDLWRERMVWKDRYHWTDDRVHQVLETDETDSICIMNEEVKIEHLATIEKIRMSAIRNVNIIQKEYNEGRINGTLRGKTVFDLARSLQGVQNYEKALKLYREYIERPDTIDLEKAIAYTMMGDLYRSTGDFVKAKDCAMKVISLNPDIPDGYVDMASALYGEGRNREAVAFFELSFKFPPCKNFPINPTKYTTVPLRILAFAYFDLGKVKEAMACAIEILKKNPDNLAMLEMLRECRKINNEIRIMDNIIELKEAVEYDPVKLKSLVGGLPDFAYRHPSIKAVK